MDKAKLVSLASAAAPILVSIGALNFLFVGLFEYDLLEEIVGNEGSATSTTPLAKILYILIGASAVYTLGWVSMVMKKLK
ncbi:DUF378 domain-containing protein [Coraliomargarita akajimensis]|uniref:DUF378 domain-containing protein n=1 Tax=Coraliomargarita akajimensis (strain DSM 45221 / IAM 15411 / JCM 23193 / KCTC 12865 / 04OKA010-24) TaxID=583355 RepID=D5EP94_CORAD|nr:DUF378 domain-containing protein [Coraliomargarita akajimensis]ADE55604.1 protein of unknown function DUF378 [Coraliomargarita akajimensis DSM 45221]